MSATTNETRTTTTTTTTTTTATATEHSPATTLGATTEHGAVDPQQDAAEHLERYGEHARRLQTWIGVYGVGVASLLVYQFRTYSDNLGEAAKAVARRALGEAMVWIAYAIAAQVLLLFINKFTQVVLGNLDNKNDRPRIYKASGWISVQIWIDFLADAASVVFLFVATKHALRALGIDAG